MKLTQSLGPYKAGTEITTDAKAAILGQGEPPCRVDRQRFETWREQGLLQEPPEDEGPKKGKRTTKKRGGKK